MTKPKSDSSFTDAVAKFYESTLVPLIFEPYADDLAERTRVLAPGSVLEVACGTGVVTRALATALPASCAITATDLNQEMVACAESVGTARAVTWRQADVMQLPFPDASFDVVVCQFATMFFPDRVAAYREIRRVLVPGGTVLFNVWSDIECNVFADVITRAVGTLFPEDPPVFLARTPYGHGAPAEIESEVSAAGFARWDITPRDDTSIAETPEFAAIAFCHGTPLRNEIESRDPGGLDRATAVATAALRERFGDGPVRGEISAVVVDVS